MAENQTIKERLIQFISYLGIGQAKFEKECGLANAYVSNIRVSVTPTKLEQITHRYPELNPAWLMTGDGEMLRKEEEVDTHTDIINIPVLNLDIRGGLDYNNVIDAEQYASAMMPFSRRIATEGDVVVPVYGDSMTPRYPSGSHILIRPLPLWREWLELGNAYVLELADWRRTIKIVRKGQSEATYRLECYNPDYDPTEIPIKMIEHMYQVLAVVKREVM